VEAVSRCRFLSRRHIRQPAVLERLNPQPETLTLRGRCAMLQSSSTGGVYSPKPYTLIPKP
jgi:hypothetical protein